MKQQERFPKEENEVPTAGCQNRGHKTPKNSTRDKRGYKNKAIIAGTKVLDLQKVELIAGSEELDLQFEGICTVDTMQKMANVAG